MKRNVKLEWYVLNADDMRVGNGNTRFYNVLNDGFVETLKKQIKKKKAKTFEEIRQVLKDELMYLYWSRAEYEIKVGGLFAKEDKDFDKIDVYMQAEQNLDIMTKYVMENLKIK